MNQEQPTKQRDEPFRRLIEPFAKVFRRKKEAEGTDASVAEAAEAKRIWKSLSRKQRLICIDLSFGAWSSGFSKWYIDEFLPELRADWSDVEKLIEMGVIDAQPQSIFSQHWLEANTEKVAQYDAIRAAKFRFLEKQENAIIGEVSWHKDTAQSNRPELWYRLKDEAFHNWIVKKSDKGV